jgi:hypothetical protein
LVENFSEIQWHCFAIVSISIGKLVVVRPFRLKLFELSGGDWLDCGQHCPSDALGAWWRGQ